MMDFSKYPKELIRSIAEEIDIGMICFLNTDTLEVESVLEESYNAYGDDDFKDFYQEVYDKVDDWEILSVLNLPNHGCHLKLWEILSKLASLMTTQ